MMTQIKWLFASIIVITLVLGVVYASTTQNQAVHTTSEIEFLADTLHAGVIRADIDANGKTEQRYFNKDELIANLSAKVVSVQKKHPYDIHLDYVFFDKNGHVTNKDEKIRSIQFRLQYVNDKGEVKANAERHLAINQL